MAATVRDWNLHGVDLKIELATSGSLVLGGNETDFPFNTGGSNGAPAGWTVGEYPPPGAWQLYNYTTATNVFSVSVKVVPTDRYYAGIWSQTFPLVVGSRYQIGVQARQMAGKTASVRTTNLEMSNDNGATWWTYAGASGIALTDWENVLAVGNFPVSAGYTLGRINLLGSFPSGSPGLWGTQFQGLFITQIDQDTAPIVWHDVTCDVQSIGIRYGREKFTNRYDVASLSLQLLNNEGEYSFHTNHPLGLRPGRQVRVTATYKGVTYPQAFQVIDSITDAFSLDGLAISRWQCVDPTTVLSNATVASSQATALAQAGARITVLLDQVGYAPRLIDPGASAWYMQPVLAKGSSIRDECGVTADSEGGNFFADRSGNVVYKDRNWRTTDIHLNQVQADLVAYPHEGSVMPSVDPVPTDPNAALICVNALDTDWSLARVINLVQLANAGGTAQTFTNVASFKAYGPHTYQRMDFVLNNDFHLPERAADIMNNYTDPVLRVNNVAFAPGMSGAWEFTLGAFLNWMVRVWYSHPTEYWGYAVVSHIQSIEHRISPTDWSTSFTVDLPESFVELKWAIGYGWDDGTWDEVLWDQDSPSFGSLWNEGKNWSDPSSVWGA